MIATEYGEGQNQARQILDFARYRFLRYGYSNVTIDEIAAELRMSKATFYRCFISKEDLLTQTIHSYSDVLLNSFTVKCVNTIEGCREEFKRLTMFISDALAQLDPRACEDIRSSVPHIWEKHQVLQHESIASLLSRFMRSGAEMGVLSTDLDPARTGKLLAMSLAGILSGDVVQSTGIEKHEALDSLTDILFAGLLTTRIQAAK
jgi:AcrR family transcriptional regulator